MSICVKNCAIDLKKNNLYKETIVELSHLLSKVLDQYKGLEYFWLDLNCKFNQVQTYVHFNPTSIPYQESICDMHDFSKQVSTQKANVSYEKPLYQNILQLANIVSRGLDHAAIDIDLDAVGVVCILSCLDSSSQWRRQKWAEGVCPPPPKAISISPSVFEKLKTPLSRQCSQKKKGVRGCGTPKNLGIQKIAQKGEIYNLFLLAPLDLKT